MRVRELATSLDITPDTVRYYTRIGYLKPIKNPRNGYKEFCKKDWQRLRFILSARQIGFSVNDIGQILKEADMQKTPCPTTRKIMELRLRGTEQRFRETALLRTKIKTALKIWKDKPDQAPTGKMICHLIEEFSARQVENASV